MDRSEVAREVNRHILALAERYGARGDPSSFAAFLCECGCFRVVELTAADYEASGGAFRSGHGAKPDRIVEAELITAEDV